MSEKFDPYRKWLGIPPHQQPPHYYRLLGLEAFENDPDTIENAADQRMAHVRTFQSGRYANLSQRILNQISTAKVCLLDREKKAAYDARLKAKLAPAAAAVPKVPAPLPRAAALPAQPAAVAPHPAFPQITTANDPAAAPRKPLPWHLYAIVGGAAVLTLLLTGGVVVFAVSRLNRSAEQPVAKVRPAADADNGRASDNPSSPDDRAGGNSRENGAAQVNGVAHDNGASQGNHTGREANVPSVGAPIPATAPNASINASSGSNPAAGTSPAVPAAGTTGMTTTPVAPQPVGEPATGASATATSTSPPPAQPAPTATQPVAPATAGSPTAGTPGTPSPAAPSTSPPPTESTPPPVTPPATPAPADSPSGALPGSPAAEAKLEVPSEEELQTALQRVKQTFADDYRKAREPEAKLLLANSLQGTASSSKDDAVRYELLDEARRLAAEAGDLPLSLQVADRLEKEFELDGSAVKAETFDAAAGGVHSPAQLHSFLREAVTMIDQAVAADSYDAAERVCSIAGSTVRRAKETALIKGFVTRGKEISTLSKRYQALAEARTALAANPSDPAASLELGRFLAFEKGDWDAGLKLLAEGSDAELSALAKAELRSPAAANEQTALAEAWRKAAQSADGAAEEYADAKASYWLSRAASSVSGIERLKYEKQLAEFDASIAKNLARNLPSGAMLAMSFEPASHFGRDGAVCVKDRMLPGRAGTVTGNVAFVPGIAGTGIEFDGATTLEVPGDFPSGAAPRTMMLWIKANDINQHQVPLAWGKNNGQLFGIRIDEVCYPDLGGKVLKPGLHSDNAWHHHCLIYDGRQVAYVYDGKLAQVGPSALKTTPNPFLIGARSDGGYKFSGVIDELLIFRRALTEDEVKGLYYRGLLGQRISQ